jgi:natural product biosynthesis luciferase-like monooxygenase protein
MQSNGNFSGFLIGSESLLIHCAETLLQRGHDVRGVITDAEPIARWAAERGVRVLDARTDWLEALREEPFDYLFAITWLHLLPDEVLALPGKLAINFHDGPLPRYAGLNVTTWALLNGEPSHGIAWHGISSGTDEGDLLLSRDFNLAPDETSLTLNTRCYEAGMESFGELLDALGGAEPIRPKPQDLSQRTYFVRHDRPDAAAVLDWNQDAETLARTGRALDFGSYANPVAVPKFELDGTALAASRIELLDESSGAAAGTVVGIRDDGLQIAASNGDVLVSGLRSVDGSELAPAELARRHGLHAGSRLPLLGAERREKLNELNRALAPHESFWVRRLETLEPAELPYAATAGEEQRGTTLRFQNLCLPDAAGSGEHDARRVLAAFLAYLARVGGKDRLHIDYRDADLELQVDRVESLFASHVPLRVVLDHGASATSWEEQVGEELARVRRRGTHLRDVVLRFPELVQAGAWDGHALPVTVAIVSDLDAFQPHAGRAFTLAVAADGSRARIACDGSVYGEEETSQIAGQLETLLAAAWAEPQRAVGDLPLLSDAERRRVLTEWNETRADFDRSRCVHQLFEEQVEHTPEAVAVVFEGDSIRYRELNERANRLAHQLRELGVGPDVLVGVCVERSIDMMVATLATLKAGGAYVPLDPAFPAERIALMIADSRAPVLLTQRALLPQLPEHAARVVCVDDEAGAADDGSAANPDCGVGPENLAYVIYTSGSTGVPKGVLVEHRNVVNFFHGMDERIAHDPPGVLLAVTSLSFDISVLELFWTLARGFEVVIYSDSERERAAGGQGAAADSRPIDFSIFYFSSDAGERGGDQYRLMLEGAKFADANGWLAVWTPERHFHAFGGLFPNPSVTGAALAAVTENVRIRSGSCVLPLHHPIRVAEEWSVVDNLSRGRVDISFAAGWQPNDFVLQPENHATAKQVMFENIETVKRLWRGDELTFPGPKGDVAVRTLPRPVQDELPVWITTAGNVDTYVQTARAGFNILTHLLGQTVDDVAEKVRAYRQAWREAGHPGEGHISLMLHTFVAEDDDFVRETAREPMKGYLSSAMSLVKEAAWYFPTFQQQMEGDEGKDLDEIFASMTEEENDALLDFAYERYYQSSGLFGTPQRCAERVAQLRAAGVDEIACLIDFGIDSEVVLEHLPHLDRVRREAKALERLAPAEAAFEEGYSLPALLERHAVTHMQCTPSMAHMLTLTEEARPKLGGLQVFMIGGEAFPAALAQELAGLTSAELVNMYGPTETTIWSATHVVDADADDIPIGRPVANTALYVVDSDLRPMPVGAPGELLIGGEGVVRGYHERPDLTAERFVPDPFSGREGSRL